MNLIVDVTQDDIDNGVPEDEHHCPIAMAVRRKVPTTECVTVDVGQLLLVLQEHREQHFEADLPISAMKFVKNFDDGSSVHPFKFAVTMKLKRGWE